MIDEIISDEIAKEVSPYLSDMENVYYNLVDALLKQGEEQEQAERSAALGAVVAGLTWSRNTPTVSENTMKLLYACEMFRIRMSIKKMMQIGVLKAEICGKDENGWEMYKILECPYGIGGET